MFNPANLFINHTTQQRKGMSPILLTGLMAGLLTLSGCTKNNDDVDAGAEATTTTPSQSIKIATEGAYAPFNYTDANGELKGFDIDVVNALCAEMNADCTIVAQDWDGIIPGLQAKKYDAIAAGMSITPERSEVVSFTDPYFTNSLIFIGHKDMTVDNADINDKVIGAQRSTIAAQYLEDKYAGNNDIKLYDTQSNAYLDLVSGRIDVMLSDKVPALDWLKSEEADDFSAQGSEIDIDDKIAIAVRKDDPLLAQFNTALSTIKSNGTYDKISADYFSIQTEQAIAAIGSIEDGLFESEDAKNTESQSEDLT